MHGKVSLHYKFLEAFQYNFLGFFKQKIKLWLFVIFKVKDEPLDIQPNKGEKWIGVVSVDEDQVEKKGSSKQEWFAAAVINKASIIWCL